MGRRDDHRPECYSLCGLQLVDFAYRRCANRLADGLSIPAGALVSEVAGRDNQHCGLGVVGADVASSSSNIIETDRRRAIAGGLTATRARDGNVTVVKADRAGDGTDFVARSGAATGLASRVDVVVYQSR